MLCDTRKKLLLDSPLSQKPERHFNIIKIFKNTVSSSRNTSENVTSIFNMSSTLDVLSSVLCTLLSTCGCSVHINYLIKSAVIQTSAASPYNKEV